MKSNKQNDAWDAQYYKRHSEGQFKSGMSIISELQLHGNESVLDIGCGDGRLTAEIAKKVPHGYVLGVDISQNMITEAQKSFGDIKNLEFQCHDATTFSCDKKFDLTVSFTAFHWIKDQVTALKIMYKHLKPGGVLRIKMTAPYKNVISEVYASAKWAKLLSQNPETFFPQTVEAFTALLKTCSFNNIDIKQVITPHTFESKQALFNWAFAWIPQSTGLPDDKAREFTHDIVNQVCNTRSDGKIMYESAHLDVRAVK